MKTFYEGEIKFEIEEQVQYFDINHVIKIMEKCSTEKIFRVHVISKTKRTVYLCFDENNGNIIDIVFKFRNRYSLCFLKYGEFKTFDSGFPNIRPPSTRIKFIIIKETYYVKLMNIRIYIDDYKFISVNRSKEFSIQYMNEMNEIVFQRYYIGDYDIYYFINTNITEIEEKIMSNKSNLLEYVISGSTGFVDYKHYHLYYKFEDRDILLTKRSTYVIKNITTEHYFDYNDKLELVRIRTHYYRDNKFINDTIEEIKN